MEMKGKERKKSRKEAKEVTNEGGKERQSVARDERTDGRVTQIGSVQPIQRRPSASTVAAVERDSNFLKIPSSIKYPLSRVLIVFRFLEIYYGIGKNKDLTIRSHFVQKDTVLMTRARSKSEYVV